MCSSPIDSLTIASSSMGNLLSGLLGALIAVVLTVIFSRLYYCSRLNKIRKSLLNYIQTLGKEKLATYVSNMQSAMELTTKFPEDTDDGGVFDSIPQLTSEIFKVYEPSELFTVSGNSKTYYDILDAYYCIEFLKDNLALNLYNEYTTKALTHFEEKGALTLKQKIKHYKECPYLQSLSKKTLKNMELKLQTASGVSESFKSLEKNLSGRGIKWIFRYFLSF